MLKTIAWTENQWDIFLSLAPCFRKLVCIEVLGGEDSLKTLKWVVSSIYGYKFNLDEMTII
jgi:hypothetical protein